MTEINLVDQDILAGSLKVTSNKKQFIKDDYMVNNMEHNQAYKNFIIQNEINDNSGKILKTFQDRYKAYRLNWTNNAKSYYSSEVDLSQINNPQCIDIETAAICDLACPHCFREYLLTPDKIMSMDLYKNIMQQIKILNIPSIKLNWRGEPLLNPHLIHMIQLAKENNVLDVAINTNATTLNETKSNEILESGLDSIIFSFDGGTKQTYEKLRPGRFKKNSFDKVYQNIKKFCILKKEQNKIFPITKIQMVITNETKNEIEDFYDLFEHYVDDITVTPYQERGGGLNDVDQKTKNKLEKVFKDKNLNIDTPYLSKGDGKLYISEGRKSCYQPLQRLMITYDGMVAMCCLDWGAQYCVGYLDELAYQNQKEIEKVKTNIDNKKKGFELLKNAKYPNKYNTPEKKVSSLKEIWNGGEINKVREIHKKKQLDKLEICKKCPYTETYEWAEI